MSDVAGETILVGETGKGDFQVEVRGGTSAVLMDKPIQAGGLGSGPNPYDLLSAAIGACALMRIRLYPRRKRGSIIETKFAKAPAQERRQRCTSTLWTLVRPTISPLSTSAPQ
jgi:uncharacterized OsmC-like protein